MTSAQYIELPFHVPKDVCSFVFSKLPFSNEQRKAIYVADLNAPDMKITSFDQNYLSKVRELYSEPQTTSPTDPTDRLKEILHRSTSRTILFATEPKYEEDKDLDFLFSKLGHYDYYGPCDFDLLIDSTFSRKTLSDLRITADETFLKILFFSVRFRAMVYKGEAKYTALSSSHFDRYYGTKGILEPCRCSCPS